MSSLTSAANPFPELTSCIATAIGIPTPVTLIRHTEKIQLTVTPEELAPANQKN